VSQQEVASIGLEERRQAGVEVIRE
jgi:hypothetical protein